MATTAGIEPTSSDLESDILPLNYVAIMVVAQVSKESIISTQLSPTTAITL